MSKNDLQKAIALLFCILSATGLYAQYNAINNITINPMPENHWVNENKRASIKESKMQVEFFFRTKRFSPIHLYCRWSSARAASASGI